MGRAGEPGRRPSASDAPLLPSGAPAACSAAWRGQGAAGQLWRAGAVLLALLALLALVLVAGSQGRHQGGRLSELKGRLSSAAAPPVPQPPTPASLSEQRLRANASELCSPEWRLRNAEAVWRGALPALFAQRDCGGMPNCPHSEVAALADSYRRRERQLREAGAAGAAADLASLLELTPCDLFSELRDNATLWMIGDSQTQKHYRALRCFLSPLAERRADGGPPRVDVPLTDDPAALAAIDRHMLQGFKSDEFGTWPDIVEPLCTHLLRGVRICHGKVHLLQHLLDAYLPHFGLLQPSLRDDVLLLNSGLWHHRNQEGLYRRQVGALAAWIAAHRGALPATVIWRETSLQHFNVSTGEFPVPGRESNAVLGPAPFACTPLRGVELAADGSLHGSNADVLRGGWRNAIASPAFRAAGVPVLGVWNESLPLHKMHFWGDCTHYCFPGAHDVWTWQLWKELRRLRGAEPYAPAAPAAAAGQGAAAAAAAATQGAGAGEQRRLRWPGRQAAAADGASAA